MTGGYYDARSTCPCCGQALPYFDELRIHEASRTVMRNGASAHLTNTQMVILRAVMNARGPLNAKSLTEIVYRDDPSGGPDTTRAVDVTICHMRKRLAPLGITIKNYVLVTMEEPHAVAGASVNVDDRAGKRSATTVE